MSLLKWWMEHYGKPEMPIAVAHAWQEATAAERERAAKVAEEMYPVPESGLVPTNSALARCREAAAEIAARIRGGN